MSKILKDLVKEKLKGDVEVIVKKASYQGKTASRLYLPKKYENEEVIIIVNRK